MEILEDAFPVAPQGWQQAVDVFSSHYPGLQLGPWKTVRSEATRSALIACQRELERHADGATRKALGSADTVLGLLPARAGLPWEWLPVGVRSLWQQRPILRLPVQDRERPAVVSTRERARILLLCDPDQTLGMLAPDLAKRLPTAEVVRLEGDQATLAQLARELNTGTYDVLVLSCWLNPGLGGLRLADGPVSLERLWEVMLCTLPRVVFLGVFSPQVDYPVQGMRELEDLAQLLLRLGAELVLGNLWPYPEWPTHLEDTLAGALNGRTVLQSLLRVRVQEAQLKPGPWLGEWSWIAWGREDVMLPGQATVGTRVSAIRPTHALEVEAGPDPGKRFELVLTRGRQVQIGRPGLKGVDVSLASDQLENRTACLSRGKDGLVLQNLTGRPDLVRVNGLPVMGECPVFPGDRLGLADCQLQLAELVRAASEPQPSPRGLLRVLRWEVKNAPPGGSVALTANLTTLGRSQECQIVVPDSSVSRVHAAFRWRAESCFVSALGSNPLVVNGVVLESERELEPGDTLLLSESVELVFERA